MTTASTWATAAASPRRRASSVAGGGPARRVLAGQGASPASACTTSAHRATAPARPPSAGHWRRRPSCWPAATVAAARRSAVVRTSPSTRRAGRARPSRARCSAAGGERVEGGAEPVDDGEAPAAAAGAVGGERRAGRRLGVERGAEPGRARPHACSGPVPRPSSGASASSTPRSAASCAATTRPAPPPRAGDPRAPGARPVPRDRQVATTRTRARRSRARSSGATTPSTAVGRRRQRPAQVGVAQPARPDHGAGAEHGRDEQPDDGEQRVVAGAGRAGARGVVEHGQPAVQGAPSTHPSSPSVAPACLARSAPVSPVGRTAGTPSRTAKQERDPVTDPGRPRPLELPVRRPSLPRSPAALGAAALLSVCCVGLPGTSAAGHAPAGAAARHRPRSGPRQRAAGRPRGRGRTPGARHHEVLPIQADTTVEPSIAVNPDDPLNAVTGFQVGRDDAGGDAANGFATTKDGGVTWVNGNIPGLTPATRGHVPARQRRGDRVRQGRASSTTPPWSSGGNGRAGHTQRDRQQHQPRRRPDLGRADRRAGQRPRRAQRQELGDRRQRSTAPGPPPRPGVRRLGPHRRPHREVLRRPGQDLGAAVADLHAQHLRRARASGRFPSDAERRPRGRVHGRRGAARRHRQPGRGPGRGRHRALQGPSTRFPRLAGRTPTGAPLFPALDVRDRLRGERASGTSAPGAPLGRGRPARPAASTSPSRTPPLRSDANNDAVLAYSDNIGATAAAPGRAGQRRIRSTTSSTTTTRPSPSARTAGSDVMWRQRQETASADVNTYDPAVATCFARRADGGQHLRGPACSSTQPQRHPLRGLQPRRRRSRATTTRSPRPPADLLRRAVRGRAEPAAEVPPATPSASTLHHQPIWVDVGRRRPRPLSRSGGQPVQDVPAQG